MRIERISPANERAAIEYLSRSPYDNVFVTYLVLYDLSTATRSRLYVASDDRGVRGVAYYGRQLALASDDAALDVFADRAKRQRGERMLIAPRATATAFWERIRHWHTRPRIVRDRQLVMVVDRERLKKQSGSVEVRHALPSEWKSVAEASAEMILQELDYDPRNASADFGNNVRAMIERDLWWVGASEGELCFYCNVGPWCTHTAQLQGIWTPPHLRGRGLASLALAGICDRLLEVTPTLSLYVNDFNKDAIALYRRIGFEAVSEYKTILF